MSRKICALLIVIILFTFIPPRSAEADALPDFCVDGTHSGDAEYLICVPKNWNGSLLIYAHGYVAFNESVGIPWDQLIFPDGSSIPEIMTQLGFAFATTSYSTNGLAVKEGLAEVIDLVDVFESLYPTPDLILLGGVSEGGLITTLAIEGYPDIFDGGLSTCGPIGDFHQQVAYWGDFRVLFDYFFPGILPPSPIDIPPEVIDNWETEYLPSIMAAIEASPLRTSQLFNITKAPFDPEDRTTVLQTVERQLWYNVFATNDGAEKLGGQPFDNQDRIYSGFTRLRLLNQRVERFSADQIALDTIDSNYQTTGNFQVPLVTVHTTRDEVVPYWHETLFRQKVAANGDLSLYTHIPVNRYGHCNFDVIEVLAGFAVLLFQVSGESLDNVQNVLPDADSYDAYVNLSESFGVLP